MSLSSCLLPVTWNKFSSNLCLSPTQPVIVLLLMVLASSPWDVQGSPNPPHANSSLDVGCNVLNISSATAETAVAASLSPVISNSGDRSLLTLLESSSGSSKGSSCNCPSWIGAQDPGIGLARCNKEVTLDKLLEMNPLGVCRNA